MNLSSRSSLEHPQVLLGDTAELPEQFLEAMHSIFTSELLREGGGDEQDFLIGMELEETRKRQIKPMPGTVETGGGNYRRGIQNRNVAGVVSRNVHFILTSSILQYGQLDGKLYYGYHLS